MPNKVTQKDIDHEPETDITDEEWKELIELGTLEKPNKNSRYKELIDRTMLLDEHPENYPGPCLCRLCLSYEN